jgi:hypothetical protein
MQLDSYEDALKQVAGILADSGCEVSIRGDGMCRFVFAQNGGRAAEISGTQEGDVFVELFAEGEEYPSSEGRDPMYEAATRRTLRWLCPEV